MGMRKRSATEGGNYKGVLLIFFQFGPYFDILRYLGGGGGFTVWFNVVISTGLGVAKKFHTVITEFRAVLR